LKALAPHDRNLYKNNVLDILPAVKEEGIYSAQKRKVLTQVDGKHTHILCQRLLNLSWEKKKRKPFHQNFLKQIFLPHEGFEGSAEICDLMDNKA
jgi:hypothetical protein